MRRLPFERSVQFREIRVLEDPDENQDTREITENRKSSRTMEGAVGRAFAKRNEFPYREVPT